MTVVVNLEDIVKIIEEKTNENLGMSGMESYSFEKDEVEHLFEGNNELFEGVTPIIQASSICSSEMDKIYSVITNDDGKHYVFLEQDMDTCEVNKISLI